MNKLVAVIVFFTMFCQAQIKNGSVSYGYVSNLETKHEGSDYIYMIRGNVKKDQDLVNFSLNFNSLESYFFINPVILKGFENVDQFCDVGLVQSKFYTKPSAEESISYQNSEEIGEYVMNYFQEAKWTITKETKMIGGYLCYKATSPGFNEDGWSDNPNFIVTAWYTPKIPVSYGPNGYNGLPGLILELQKKAYTFFVKNINLNLNPEPEIKNLKDIRLLSIYQREKLISAMLSADQKKLEEQFKASVAKEKAKQEKEKTVIAPKK